MNAFMNGMARVLDIGATFSHRKDYVLHTYTKDTHTNDNAIADCWKRVGKYLFSAIEVYKNGEEEAGGGTE